MRLPASALNHDLSTAHQPVWLIDAVECAAGSTYRLVFESAQDRWRQGVWLAVDGQLEVVGQVSPQIVLWRDTAPAETDVVVRATTDGLLRLYNVWDSGRGLGQESQRATSGMVRTTIPNGWRYRCSDINPSPTFEALVFHLERRN